MRDTDFTTILHPEQCSLDELNIWINRYPYFTLLRIIRLLKIRNETPEVFNEELKKNSIYFHDRKKVYQLLQSPESYTIISDALKYSGHEEDIIFQISDEDEIPDLLEFSYSEENTENENTDSPHNEHPSFSPAENPQISSVPESEKSPSAKNLQKKDSLIDRFLENSPGPIRADKKTMLSGDVSKNSVKENDSLLSDKLAQIYVKQGLYSKAIFAYKKLSLKYPEKSAYFAAQIEEIENLINNK